MSALVINAGSSSVKFQVLDPGSGQVHAKGLVERIGEPSGEATLVLRGEESGVQQPFTDHTEALGWVLDRLGEGGLLEEVEVVGHRVVHGGRRFTAPVLLDDAVVEVVRELSPLAPLHNPANVLGIEAARQHLPQVPHVGVFDTAFFADLPAEARTYALDAEVAERHRIARYGFHGTSHDYVSERAARDLGRSREDLRTVVLHLGNGASASAVRYGRPVDTTMGMTPLEGLVMGTRTGDLDPGVILHLQRQGMSAGEVDELLNHRSGLKGMTGTGDMREVRAAATAGDERARLALDVSLHRLVRYVGAFHAVMGGLDALVFTAGVGENNVELRAELCERLAALGVVLDEQANASVPRGTAGSTVVSAPESSVAVLVTPTNEELAIARAAQEAVAG
ncbi:acetate/propionate family kinase [Kytococcus schroeteri]|uniref:acetate/propionate family kinase n=1 Tax=Kytococcus schroeteri TaxID=138300 RepID=UPI001142F5BF|nr:acetate kinase [Kytococcus schroeteri]